MTPSHDAGGAVTPLPEAGADRKPINVVVFDGKDATAPTLFTGQAVTGPASVDYTFPAPPPGTYFFHCQFHPTTMKGTLVIR